MRTLFISLLLLLLVIIPAIAQQEVYKPRIAVIPMKNASEDTQYDSICARATDTIELTLSLLDKYSIERVTNIDPIANLEQAKKFLKEKNYDNAIFGQAILNPKDGLITLQCSVYDLRKNAVSVQKEVKITNIFNIFNASEELITSVIENFAGVRIGFGSFRIDNTGEKGAFEVYVDDSKAILNQGVIEQVLIGSYNIKVVQTRMKGEYVLYEKTISVTRNAETVIPIKIPYLLPDEETTLAELDDIINSNFADPEKRGTVESAFAKIGAFLADVSFAERLEQKRTEYKRLHTEYRKQFGDFASEMFRIYINFCAGYSIVEGLDISYFEFPFDYEAMGGIELLTEWGAFGIGFGFSHINFSYFDSFFSTYSPRSTKNSPTAEIKYSTLFDFFAQGFTTFRITMSEMELMVLLSWAVGGTLQFFDPFALQLGFETSFFAGNSTSDPTFSWRPFIGMIFYP